MKNDLKTLTKKYLAIMEQFGLKVMIKNIDPES